MLFNTQSVNEVWEQLRSFGLDRCDLATMVWNVAVGLRLLTLNIESKYDKGISLFSYFVTVVTGACFYYVFFFSMTWFVLGRCSETGDLVAAMVVLSLGISSEIGPVKLFYMFVHIDKIKKITDDYLDCDTLTIPGSRFHTNLQKAQKVIKKRALIYWSVIVVNGILYLLKPVLQPGRNLPENYFIIYGLEPMFETPNYEIACFMMAAGVFFICYVPACVTTYFIIIAGYTEAQILALSEELLQIWPDAVKKAEIKTNSENINELDIKYRVIINEAVQKRLKEIIIRHALLITLFRNVEDVFRGAVAMGFFLLVLGLLSELLGKLENTYLQLPFALMQVGMDCFTGQRVMDASIVFEQAVYDCKWENFDKTNMKMILVMLQSSQKTMTLSAGGLATLSFSCMMSVFRGIYSAYTALRSTI